MGHKPLPVSLCMIARNEENYLEECILSAEPLVEQIVVCDTGSDDNTITLARELGATTRKIKWENDFAAARNESIKLAEQPWILVLDADERISDYDFDILESIINDPQAIAAEVEINNLNDRGLAQKFTLIRLFRNDPSLKYDGKIHESLNRAVIELQKKKGGTVCHSSIRINHLGYLSEHVERKGERNLHLLAEQLRNKPNNLFFLLKHYEELEKLGRQQECDVEIEKTYNILRNTPESEIRELPYAPTIMANYAQIQHNNGDHDEVLKATDWWLSLFGEEPWAVYFKALALIEKSELDDAVKLLERCQKLDISSRQYYVEPAISTWLSWYNIAKIKLMQQKTEESITLVNKCISAKDDFHPAHELLVEALLRKQDFKAAISTCINLLKRNDRDIWALVNGAQILAILGLEERAITWLNKVLEIDPTQENAKKLLGTISER